SGGIHSSPYSARRSPAKNGEAAAIGWIAEQTSCTKPGNVNSALRVPPPMVGSASWTRTRRPARASSMAAERPLGPLPTTTASGMARKLLQLVELREQLVVRDQVLGTVEDLLVANRPRLIDDHIGPFRIPIEPVFRIGLEESVGFQRRARKVADQGKGETHLLAPRLAGRHEVRADAQDLGIAALELGQVELESR